MESSKWEVLAIVAKKLVNFAQQGDVQVQLNDPQLMLVVVVLLVLSLLRNMMCCEL